METGDLVFVDGATAGIVVGLDVDPATGAPTGDFFVGHFASITKQKRGDYGSSPGPAPDRAAIAADEARIAAGGAVPLAGVTSVPVAPVAATGDAPAVEAVPTGADVLDLGEPDDAKVTETGGPASPRTQLDGLLASGTIDQATYDAAVAKLPASE